MATYAELKTLQSNTAVKDKVQVAITKKAQTLIDQASPTPPQLAWARAAYDNPDNMADQIYLYVLAANSSATVAQIQNASDSTIQTNVDNVVDKIIAAGLV